MLNLVPAPAVFTAENTAAALAFPINQLHVLFYYQTAHFV